MVMYTARHSLPTLIVAGLTMAGYNVMPAKSAEAHHASLAEGSSGPGPASSDRGPRRVSGLRSDRRHHLECLMLADRYE